MGISPPATVDKEQGDWVRNPGFKGHLEAILWLFSLFFFLLYIPAQALRQPATRTKRGHGRRVL